MCRPSQSQQVSCFNVDNWNLVARTRYNLHSPGKKQLALQSLPLPSTADLIHGIKTEQCEFCMNKSFTSILLHFTLFLLFFPSVVHLCRSLRRGRCCKLCKKAPNLLTPCPEIEMNSLIVEVDIPYTVCKPSFFQQQCSHMVLIW